MAVIRGSGPAAERLRAFVRERIRKDGAHYERGAGVKLARHLKRSQPWVSRYIDAAPRGNADFDTALAICRFFRVNAADFELGSPVAAESSTPKLNRYEARVLRLLRLMNEEGQQLAVRGLAGFAAAFPKPAWPQSSATSHGTLSATARKDRGKP